MFAKETYVGRRAGLNNRLDSGLILLLGNEESSMNYGANPYPFRQDSSFLYYFGLDDPHLAAVIDLDEGKETLFGDDLTVEDIVWMGTKPLVSERCERIGVSKAAPYGDLAAAVKAALAKGRQIHFLPPYRGENMVKLQDLLGIAPAEGTEKASKALIRAVVDQRAVKSEEEIKEIEFALEISRDMHLLAMKQARPGILEQDLAGAVEGLALSRGGRVAYPVILTVRGETLHNHYHGNLLEAGHMVLNDSGAESPSRYASDITRTFPVSDRFSPEQRELYDLVLDAQMQVIESLKPGVQFKDMHLLASRVLAAGLKEMGLMRGDVDEAVREGAHALFFQCGLGHMMGLDVHDMEDLGEAFVGYDDTVTRSSQFGICHLRLARALQQGFVVTVEPGVYFIPELIDLWKSEKKLESFIDYGRVEAFRDFGGIRIEDNLLVTGDGYRVLGPSIPKTVEEVETAVGS